MDKSNVVLIGITGASGSGKGVISGIIKELVEDERDNKYYLERNFARKLKQEIASLFHDQYEHVSPSIALAWIEDNKKMLRPLLQSYGEIRRTIFEDYWVNEWNEHYNGIVESFAGTGDSLFCVVSDVRYHNEVDRLQSLGAKMIRVTSNRPSQLTEKEQQHSSEALHSKLPCDVIIKNDRSFEEEGAYEALKSDVLKVLKGWEML